MLVTRILAGRPYQSYVPRPLFPAVDDQVIRRFDEVDAALASTCDTQAFSTDAVAAIVQPRNKRSASDRFPAAQRALETLLSKRNPGVKHLKASNGLLTSDSTRSEFRTMPVWMGAPHPGVSWHVGSPPDMLPRLVKTLVEDMPTRFPASLAATLLLFRLLQIHPFVDGNGRTARLWSLCEIHRRIGPACGYLRLLDRLWDRTRFDLNALSLAVQLDEDFTPVFSHVETLLRKMD